MQANREKLALVSCTAILTFFKLAFKISLNTNKQNNDLKCCGPYNLQTLIVKSFLRLGTWQRCWKNHKINLQHCKKFGLGA